MPKPKIDNQINKRASEIHSVEESRNGDVENPQMGEEYENIILVNDVLSDASEDELSMDLDETPKLSIVAT